MDVLDQALKKLSSSSDALSATRIQGTASAALANAREYKEVVHKVEGFIRKQGNHSIST